MTGKILNKEIKELKGIDNVVAFSGRAGSGKSKLAFSTVAKHIAENKKIVFIFNDYSESHAFEQVMTAYSHFFPDEKMEDFLKKASGNVEFKQMETTEKMIIETIKDNKDADLLVVDHFKKDPKENSVLSVIRLSGALKEINKGTNALITMQEKNTPKK